MTNTWKTPEWKEKRDAFLQKKIDEGKGFCKWCNTTENLVPAHKRKRGGYTNEEYMDLEKNCYVLCSKCNFMEGKRFKLCPVCKKGYYKPKRKRDPMCWHCLSKLH